MKNIEKLARYLGTKRNPDQILEFLIQLPLDQFGTPEFSNSKCVEALSSRFQKQEPGARLHRSSSWRIGNPNRQPEILNKQTLLKAGEKTN